MLFSTDKLIYIYMIVCFCMMGFNIVYIFYKKSSDEFIKKRSEKLRKKIDYQLFMNDAYTLKLSKHKRMLLKVLKKVNNLMAFDEAIDQYNGEKKKEIYRYIKSIRDVFCDLAPIYNKKSNIKKAYFAYIMSKYKISQGVKSDRIISTMFEFLEEKSIYCRENALKALYSFGNVQNVIKALKIINVNKAFYSKEVLTFGLASFNGNHEELAESLWNNFENFEEKMQLAIIDYLGIVSKKYKERLYDLLIKEDTSKNIKISIVYYFEKNVYKPVKDILINYLELAGIENLEYALASAEVLRKYPGIDTINSLKHAIRSRNWKIRVKASESLAYLNVQYIELAEIYNGTDRIAREILQYKVKKRLDNMRKKDNSLTEVS